MITANNRWCEVDFLTFESIKVKNIHVLGDAIQIAPAMPKSGHMANRTRRSARRRSSRCCRASRRTRRRSSTTPATASSPTRTSCTSRRCTSTTATRRRSSPVQGAGGLSPALDAARGRVRVHLGEEHLGGCCCAVNASAIARRPRVHASRSRSSGATRKAKTAPAGAVSRSQRASAAQATGSASAVGAAGALLEHQLHLAVVVEVDRHLAAARPAGRTAARRRAPCGSCPG